MSWKNGGEVEMFMEFPTDEVARVFDTAIGADGTVVNLDEDGSASAWIKGAWRALSGKTYTPIKATYD